MKSYLSLFFFLTASTLFAQKEIPVTIDFYGETDIYHNSSLLILQDEEVIYEQEIETPEAVDVNLPKGLYTFYLKHGDDKTQMVYRVSKKNNEVKFCNFSLASFGPLKLPTKEELIESLNKGEFNNFIVYSFTPYSQSDIDAFREKYGVGFQVHACATTPFDIANSHLHNQTISDFLTEKFGDSWEKEMPNFVAQEE